MSKLEIAGAVGHQRLGLLESIGIGADRDDVNDVHGIFGFSSAVDEWRLAGIGPSAVHRRVPSRRAVPE
jgi:hypothetical protein